MRLNINELILIEKIDESLAKFIFVIGSFLTSLLVYVNFYQPIILTITMQATAAIYLLLRKHFSTLASEVPFKSKDWSRFFVPVSVFLISMIAVAGTVSIAASADSLQRPLYVFFLFSVIPSLIVIQALFFIKFKNIELSILIQIVTLTIAIVLSGVTVFPYNGGDTWAHIYNAEIILENHTTQAIPNIYRDYPLYPALLATISLLSGVGVGEVARFVNAFVAVISLLLLYSLARQFFSFYKSLVLALLLLGSKWFIYWSLYVVSMIMSQLFICLLAVLLIDRVYGDNNSKKALASILVVAILPFFHPVVAVAAMLLLAAGWLVELFFGKQNFTSRFSHKNLLIFAVTVTLVQWMYFGQIIFNRTVNELVKAVTVKSSESVQLAESGRSFQIYTIDELNFYFLLGLAVIGILLAIRSKKVTLDLYAGCLGLFFVFFSFTTQLINLQVSLPYRWLLFGTLLLVFPASSAFVNLFPAETSLRRIAAISLLITTYFYLGLTNTETNRDRPLYDEINTALVEVTSSEYAGLIALQDIIQNREAEVKVDFRLWDYLKFRRDKGTVQYWDQINVDRFNGIFPIRDAYFTRNLLLGESASELNLDDPNISQFYDSGDLQIIEYQYALNNIE